jgi:hypothetical protein
MKTIIFLFALILSVAMISIHKKTSQNVMPEKAAKPVQLNAVTNQKYGPEAPPRILFMLNNSNQSKMPSLWWNYEQAGC